MIDLAFIARAAPAGKDPFWRALHESGLAPAPCPPDRPGLLAAAGIAIFELPVARAARGEIDREAAAERAREALSAEVEGLERRVAASGVRVAAFLGTTLYAAALGPRSEPGEELDEEGRGADRSARTFAMRARFGGAVAVAIPHISKHTPPALFLERMRDLARLRRELTQARSDARGE